MNPEVAQRLLTRIEEIKALYNVSDAEGALLTQLIETIQRLGWTKSLAARMLKIGAAIMEATMEETSR